MQQQIVIVLDCGATNVRAVAINEHGELIAKHAIANNTRIDPFLNGGLIWDVNEIYDKLISCLQHILAGINKESISAVTITTFGVNGTFADKHGNYLYPCISWQCQRTKAMMDEFTASGMFDKVYGITGVQNYSFNTLYNFLWFKQNRPDVIENAERFLFVPSLLVHKLTGEFANDITMAGTSMTTNLVERKASDEIFATIGIENKMGELHNPGHIAGVIHARASKQTGLPIGIPVILAGHDTQFAVLGSGVGVNEPILSSGTWEILMVRSQTNAHTPLHQQAGITNEFDAEPGLYNTGLQWLASGILEWICRSFYTDHFGESGSTLHNQMMDEAMSVQQENMTVRFEPGFLNNAGEIRGLGVNTKREEIYLAALIALSEKTRQSMETLEKACHFKANALTIVGGGGQNTLWNQIRANTLGIPVKILNQSETTVLGASMVSFVKLGVFNSFSEAKAAYKYDYKTYFPNKSE